MNKWKSKSDQLNEQKWQLVSRHQCWFASCLFHNTTLPSNRTVQLPYSAEHYHSEVTTQCWLPHPAIICDQPFDPSIRCYCSLSSCSFALISMFQNHISNRFHCFHFFRSNFPQISKMGIKQSKRTVDISSTPKKGEAPAKVSDQICLDRKTNPRRPSFDRRTNLAPLFVLDFHMGMTWWNVLVL